MKINVYTQAGLSKNEAIVYQYILERGEATPPQIADRLDLGRTNVYAIINNLIDFELVEEMGRKKKMTLRPTSPTNLLALAEKRKVESEENEKMVRAVMPQLISMYHLGSGKPGITHYEGLDGIKKIYEERLKEKPEEVLVFRSIYDNDRLGPFLQGYVKRTAIAGIKTRIISTKPVTKEVAEKDKLYLRSRKYIPESIFSTETQIDIYNDRVAFVTLGKKMMGFIITSKSVASTMRKIFEITWNSK